MSSFLKFVIDNQLPIAKDVKKPWFQKVWMPLTMRQIIDQNELMRHSQLTIPSITSDIFKFLGYEGAPGIQQQNFERLLDRAEIPFKRISFNDPSADESVKEDGLQLTEYNRQQKRWITMYVDDFKDAILQLNTKRAKEIRLYYRNLESAVFQFLHHSLALLNDDLLESRDLVKQLEFNNTGLQGEIQRRREEVQDLIANRHVPRREPYDNILCFIDKKADERHQFYVIRCQRKSLETYKRCLRNRYPGMEVLGECDDANAVHAFNRFKEDVIHDFYRNHFNLDEEGRELFEITFDIEL